MRKVCLGAGTLCVALAHVSSQERLPPALIAARAAMGGAALDGVRTLRLVGRTSRDMGVLRLSGQVELRIAFPDRYVRLDRLGLGGTMSEMAVGFDRGRPIQWASGPGGIRIDPTALLPESARKPARQSAADAARQDLALLLLGLGIAIDAYPLEFSSGGRAESPDGTADVVDVRHGAALAARLFIDTQSRLPLMVSWQAPDVLAARSLAPNRGRAASPPTDSDMKEVLARVQASVEHRLYFSDYRRTGQVHWPFRVRRAVRQVLVEDLAFDTIEVNDVLDEDAFRQQP